MGSLRKVVSSVAAAGCAVAIGACGGNSATGNSGGGNSRTRASTVVHIYSSLPLHGPMAEPATEVVDGIKLALAQVRDQAGPFTVRYRSLDDSTPGGGWDPKRTAADAITAATDAKAIYYIGEFDSGASELSAPILNQAGIPQVSPVNTYVGLTPQAYDPTGDRTYLRIVPADTVQAAVDLIALKQTGCSAVAVIHDASGTGLAALLVADSRDYGVRLVSNTSLDVDSAKLHAYVEMIKAKGVNCMELAGTVTSATVQITKAIHVVLPTARILGSDGMCSSAWTNAKDGGVPPNVDPDLLCTAPALRLNTYPGGKRFLAAYRQFEHRAPGPWAIYGYEAMRLGLDTISVLRANGDNRADVLRALFATKDRNSVLGMYGFDKSGDTTLRTYGLYAVANANPVFDKTLTATRLP